MSLYSSPDQPCTSPRTCNGPEETHSPPDSCMKEVLHSTPQRLDGIRVIPGVRINERDEVVNGAVRETDGSDITVHSPAITDSSARFDPSTYIQYITSVSAVRSGTGTRNVLPDSRSTPPNTHCP
jgi:hypothetical protein